MNYRRLLPVWYGSRVKHPTETDTILQPRFQRLFFPADSIVGPPGPEGPPGSGTQVLEFQQLEDCYFGVNGLLLGEAASLVTLTFDALADGMVVLLSTVTGEAPGLGSSGLMWLQEAGTCTYNADENSIAGIYTAK
jgi:hypothetical protein